MDGREPFLGARRRLVEGKGCRLGSWLKEVILSSPSHLCQADRLVMTCLATRLVVERDGKNLLGKVRLLLGRAHRHYQARSKNRECSANTLRHPNSTPEDRLAGEIVSRIRERVSAAYISGIWIGKLYGIYVMCLRACDVRD